LSYLCSIGTPLPGCPNDPTIATHSAPITHHTVTYKQTLVVRLETTLRYFRNTTACFDEADSSFAPDPEMFTVAAQVAHTADTVEWFVNAAFGPGWDLDFHALEERVRAVSSLAEADAWLERAFKSAIQAIRVATDEELQAPIPDERMMKGMPRSGIVNGIIDHTAHHRGSLAVYARVLGKKPAMPYA